MSHFVVLVTNVDKKGLDSQLAPFDESLELPKHIYKTKAQLIRDAKETKQRAEDLASNSEGNREWVKKYLEAKTDEDLYQLVKEDHTDADFNKDGDLLTTWNENARWDWWVEGGRWNNWLITKDWKECNRCKVKDLSLDNMRIKEMMDRAKWYVKETEVAKREHRKPFFWNYKKKPTIKQYIEEVNHLIAPYAILHDGIWMEKGEMGWWGIDDPHYTEEDWEKKFQEFFKALDPETEIAIVDCHI